MDPSGSAEISQARKIAGITLGALTSLSIYSGELFLAYVSSEMLKAGFQSPETGIISTIMILAIAALGLNDLTQNRMEGITSIITSGAKAGIAVNQAIVQS